MAPGGIKRGSSNGGRTNWCQRCNEIAQVIALDEAGREVIPPLERRKWGIIG